MKCRAVWSTSCNEYHWEKYQSPQMCRWHHPYGKKQRTKAPLDASEKGEWKSWLKTQYSENEDHGIQAHHSRVNRWGKSGNSNRLYLGGSKITADGDCSHEIKRRLLLERKVMINLDSISKSRDITLPTKICHIKAMVFPIVMYGCESWTIKLSAEELMLLNCGIGEDSWGSLGQQGDPTSPS